MFLIFENTGCNIFNTKIPKLDLTKSKAKEIKGVTKVEFNTLNEEVAQIELELYDLKVDSVFSEDAHKSLYR